MHQQLLTYGQNIIDPSTLPGRVLDLDSELGITLVSGKVDVWADQSGAGNDFSAPAAINRPVYNSTDVNFNNLPSITFDGLNTYLSGGDVFQGLSELTVFLVLRANNTSLYERFISQELAGVGNRVYAFAKTNSGNIVFLPIDYTGGIVATVGSSSIANQSMLLTHVMTNTTSALFINNVQDSPTENKSGSLKTGITNITSIGANGQATKDYFSGQLVKVVAVSSALAPNVREGIYNFFSKKYGI